MTEQPEEPTTPPHVLADLRRSAGLSTAEVARRMNVSFRRVAQIEAGYPNVQHVSLMRYMAAIGGTVRLVTTAADTDVSELTQDPAGTAIRTHQAIASEKGRNRQNPINIKQWRQRPPKN